VALQDLATGFTTVAQASGKFSNSKIAIVGMSGRFPGEVGGAVGTEALWKILEEGLDVHKVIPPDRFDVKTHYDPTGKTLNTSHTQYGCFIEKPGLFDARYFSMSPREAAQTDPMHRLALVTAAEALEMSGFVPNRTPSSHVSRVGTFYGQTSDDWREVNIAQKIDTYFIPAGVRAFAPGRINYFFKFSGPSKQNRRVKPPIAEYSRGNRKLLSAPISREVVPVCFLVRYCHPPNLLIKSKY